MFAEILSKLMETAMNQTLPLDIALNISPEGLHLYDEKGFRACVLSNFWVNGTPFSAENTAGNTKSYGLRGTVITWG